MTTRLLILRHGETEWNTLGRNMGQLDSPLTALGVEQARRTAPVLAARNVVALYSSDLGRAAHTARIIGEALQLAPRLDPRLRERHLGVFEGLTTAEMETRFPEARAAYRADPAVTPPGGESRADAEHRSVACLEEIAAAHSGGTVAVVTHGALLSHIIEGLLGLPPRSGRRFHKRNAAIHTFVRDGQDWRLESWGESAHLDSALPVVVPTPA